MARTPVQSVSRPKRRKPARPETPIRNGLLLVTLAVALIAMIGVMPSERAQLSAAGPDGQPGGYYSVPENTPLRFSEVMSSNKGFYPDENTRFPDWIELQNTSSLPLQIGGLGLSDRQDRVLFAFPEMEVPAGGFVIVFCDGQTVVDGPELHARIKISSRGETVFLFDRRGQVVERLDVPAMGRNMAYALTADGWARTEQATPGFPNTQDGLSAMRASTIEASHGLVINEMMASNRTSLSDEDGQHHDWIELHNRGATAIDLYCVFLSDDPANPLKWRFPYGSLIEPGGYLVVFASGKNRPGGAGRLPHTNFRLSGEGESLYLSDLYRQTIDTVAYENLGRDISWGRDPANPGMFKEFKDPTPGKPNDYSAEAYDAGAQ
ncbi:MAG: lamin tail domain-containing protein [Clostridia bacterium]|nr:lamin tail domain-containing protein [Clostridia bacterium]